jgi:hypothetical protein
MYSVRIRSSTDKSAGVGAAIVGDEARSHVDRREDEEILLLRIAGRFRPSGQTLPPGDNSRSQI